MDEDPEVSGGLQGSRMLWAGRFSGEPTEAMLRLTSSIGVDIRLLEHDLAATRAHARVLVRAGLFEEAEAEAVEQACAEILTEHRSGQLRPAPHDEDVHSLVERELTARLGEVGERIHAGRSRNDLVATDLRLWCKNAADELLGGALGLIEALCARAEEHLETVMPGYTHLQPAQPVSLGFHLVAHAVALERDARRFGAARHAADGSALGAGALAGTTLPLDPSVAAAELALSRTFENAMDAVSERDFACDLLYACALCGVHLSRLAEEIVMWASPHFGFASLPDEWSTGSSMMPQKRNPDLAELTRGRAAASAGELSALLGLLKALPLAYDRDLQEDKALVFSSVDRTSAALEAMTHLVGALGFEVETMGEAAGRGATWATDLAEALVGRGVPFRRAHAATGQLVTRLEEEGTPLQAASAKVLREVDKAFSGEDLRFAEPAEGMRARSGRGGTAPESVRAQIDSLRRRQGRLDASGG